MERTCSPLSADVTIAYYCPDLFCFLLVPAVPQQVDVSPDKSTQQLSISWLGGAAATFDLLILRTELNETVFYVRARLCYSICSDTFLMQSCATLQLCCHVREGFSLIMTMIMVHSPKYIFYATQNNIKQYIFNGVQALVWHSVYLVYWPSLSVPA